MKNILSLVLSMLFPLLLNAQKKDIENAHLKSSGTYFEKEVKDKKWSNKNGKSYTLAKYSDYEGVTFVKLFAEKDMTVLFEYEINVDKGKLEVQIIDSKMNIVFSQDFDTSEKGSATVDFKKGENYKLKFIGQKTKGSYFYQWTEN